MSTESLAIIETYAFLRPLVIVLVAAAVVVVGCLIALQRVGRSK